MKYWFNKESETNNVIFLNENGITVASCDEEVYEKVESQLTAKTSPLEIFGTEDLLTIPFTKIRTITSRSTDDDIDVTYKAKKDIEDKTLNFQGLEQMQSFVRALDSYLPSELIKSESQQSPLVAALSPLFSAMFGVAVAYAYFNKFRWVAIIVGGIWLAFSLAMLVSRAKNPPKITRWRISGKYASKMWNGLKTGVSYLVLIIIALGFSLKFPDSYGNKSLYEQQMHDELKVEDVATYLSRGADINYTDKDGDTPLLLAIYAEDDALAIKLIESGANLKPTAADDASMLAQAIDYNASTSVIKAMLEQGASTDFYIGDQSLLEYARELENPELVKLLEEHR